MGRRIRRSMVGACVVAAIAATVFMGVARANGGPGDVAITCTSATYNYSTFASGTQSVHETVWVDGALAAERVFDFTGRSGTDTISFAAPNDGAPHEIVANSYSITNDSTIYGLPGIVTLTCGSPPPPPVCTYTKGFYRNHPGVTASAIAGLGGSVPVGSTNLTAAQAQAVLNAAPGQAGNVTFTSNLLLNLVQQLITAELNVARGSNAPSGVQSAVDSASSAINVTLSGGRIRLSSTLSNGAASTLESQIGNFNSASDCG